MDDQVQSLVEKVWAKFLVTPPERRLTTIIQHVDLHHEEWEDEAEDAPLYKIPDARSKSSMIGIGGIPGSGKTTLSQIITKALNDRHTLQNPQYPSPIAAFVPMDGYHLTRAHLSAMPDPATAHARRGAEFTFDGASFLKLVQALKEPLPVPPPSTPPLPPSPSPSPSPSAPAAAAYPPHTILAPSFDHAVKDPKEDDIPILPTQRIVVFEGNYIALDKEPWRSASKLMDQVWFVEVDFAVARKRLAKRHVKAGLVETEEQGDRRAVENDLPNGEEIMAARVAVDEVVKSREDGAWVGV